MGRGVFNLAPASSPLSLGPIQGLGAGDAGGAFAPPLRPSTHCCCLMRLLCCAATAFTHCCAAVLLQLPAEPPEGRSRVYLCG